VTRNIARCRGGMLRATELLMKLRTRISRWIAIAGVGVIAATVLYDLALAQETEAENGRQLPSPPVLRNQVVHGRQGPLPRTPQPSNDPIDLLASASHLGFADGHHVSGLVREVETNLPVAGVWVIAAWETYVPGGYVCFDADTLLSDSAGRFEFSTWRQTWRNLGSFDSDHLRLFVYRPGYELVRLERGQILIRKVQDSQDERLVALRDIERNVRACPPSGKRDPAHDGHFRPLFIDMVAEVQALPEGLPERGYLLEEIRKLLALVTAGAR